MAGHGKQVSHGTGELQGNHCCALSLGYIWSALNGASYNQHKLRKSTAIFPMNEFCNDHRSDGNNWTGLAASANTEKDQSSIIATPSSIPSFLIFSN